MNNTLDINEIFFSIQGESSRMGLPCIFVRLSFCNLRCRWCDSTYTFTPGRVMTLEAIRNEVDCHPCSRVEITGGEPLLQENVLPLMTFLCDDGYEVLLETSGSVDISRVDERGIRVLDIKCPGSDMEARNRLSNLNILRRTDEVKFVISDRRDYEWARELVRHRDLLETCSVLFSPVFGEQNPQSLAEWILEDGLPVRYQLQLHKFIWDPSTRGV